MAEAMEAEDTEPTVRSEAEDDLPVCRICLSSEEESELVAPCRCTGTMRFVHRDCLRTWRIQGSSSSAEICPVCHAAYSFTWGALPLRMLQRFPAVSGAFLGSTLLWAWRPRLHRRIAEAAWVQVMAPFPLQWLTWESGPGLAPALCAWLLNGLVCLTVPAFLDHLRAIRRGSMTKRLVELVLLWDNAKRFSFTVVLAAVRGSLQTESGLRTMLQVHDVVHEAIDAAEREGVPPRKCVEELLDTYFGGTQGSGTGWGLLLRRRCLQLSSLCPADFFVYLKVLAAQLGCRSTLQRWLPLLWHCADREVGQVALRADLLAVFARFVVKDARSAQVQLCWRNVRDILCSARRGVQAFRLLALQFT